MAKKEDPESALRVLTTQFPYEQAGTNDGETITFGYNTGWQSVTVDLFAAGTKMAFVYNINTWDLRGYELQDKTLFPQSCIFQDLQVSPSGGGSVSGLTRMTIVSTTPLNEANISVVNNVGVWQVPGTMGSEFNLDHIIRGRLEMYQQDSTLGTTLLKTTEKSWGTGDSTAADRVWIAEVYAFVIATGVPQSFFIPDSAVVMPSLVGKEPDIEYLMRLARSTEPVY